MAQLTPYGSYRENQVKTSSRGQLLLMVYDGMLRYLEEGRRAMSESRLDVQSENLTRTQSLLIELLVTLDHTACPTVATNLDRLYRYMYDRLVWANVNDDTQAVQEVAGLLSSLRETWAEAEVLARTPTGAETVEEVRRYTA